MPDHVSGPETPGFRPGSGSFAEILMPWLTVFYIDAMFPLKKKFVNTS
jgi:hypothetical protein